MSVVTNVLKKFSKRDLFLMILMFIIAGTNNIVVKEALFNFDPFFFTSIRFLIVALVALPFCLKKSKPKKIKSLFFLSFALVVIYYAFTDIGMQLNDSRIVIAMLSGFTTIITLIAGVVFLKDKLTTYGIIGIVIAFCGIIFLACGDAFSGAMSGAGFVLDKKNLLSIGIILLGLCAWPFYIIFTKKNADILKPLEIVAWTALFGSIQCFLVSLVVENNHIEAFHALLNLKNMSSLIFTSIGGILVYNFLYQFLINKYSLYKVAIWSFLIPIVASLESIFIFNEKITLILVIGSFCILFGVLVTNYQSKPEFDTKDENEKIILILKTGCYLMLLAITFTNYRLKNRRRKILLIEHKL